MSLFFLAELKDTLRSMGPGPHPKTVASFPDSPGGSKFLKEFSPVPLSLFSLESTPINSAETELIKVSDFLHVANPVITSQCSDDLIYQIT